jgi:CheY-like chemotaxis protein
MSFIDNPVAQKLLLKQLTRLGFQVECANNGLEAVNAWNNQPEGYFIMAFFDHHMPKVSLIYCYKHEYLN